MSVAQARLWRTSHLGLVVLAVFLLLGCATITSHVRGPAFGEPVRDGTFEFTVKKVTCGHKTVGMKYVTEAAHGEFCFVTLDVRNVGRGSQTLDANNQKAFTSNGQSYDSSVAAGFAANQNNTSFMTDINPGHEVTGIVVYDVPPATKLTLAEFHESAFSHGVRAPLT